MPPNVAVIPTYRPDQGLKCLIGELRDNGDDPVAVIDDGSGPEFSEPFAAVAGMPGVTVILSAGKN